MTGQKTSKTKDEFPPLLGAGFHKKTADELKAMVVDRFPKSQRRRMLFAKLLNVISYIEQAKIACDIWVDGSFLTEKIDPDDVDFVVDIPISYSINPTPEQADIMSQLASMAFYQVHKLHSFVVFNAPAVHNAFGKHQASRAYWKDAFGHSFVKKEPKGIAVVEVRP